MIVIYRTQHDDTQINDTPFIVTLSINDTHHILLSDKMKSIVMVTVMLSAVKISVVMLSVILLTVTAPKNKYKN